jgi:hypothetical protein
MRLCLSHHRGFSFIRLRGRNVIVPLHTQCLAVSLISLSISVPPAFGFLSFHAHKAPESVDSFFSLIGRHLAPRWYRAPLSSLTSRLLPTLHTNLRNGRMSTVDSDASLSSPLSSRGSYCATLPSGLLPTAYTKLRNGRKDVIRRLRPSLS